MKKTLTAFVVILSAFMLFAQDYENNVSEQASDSPVRCLFFVGLQTGQLPELRERFEAMVRSRWGAETNLSFVSREQTLRIRRRITQHTVGRVEVDSAFFAELQKFGLQNCLVLLISVEEYWIRAVRRFFVGGAIEGRLRLRFFFYESETQGAVLVASSTSRTRLPAPPVGFRSPRQRIHISADDRRQIDRELLEDALRQGFEMMQIAISLADNSN